jgi:hypothetical protein
MVRNDTGSPLRTLYVVNDTVKVGSVSMMGVPC